MLAAAIAAGALAIVGVAPAAANRFKHIDHVVVVYEENHSFDNLSTGDGRASTDSAAPTPRT